jgi:hypothetical protein
VHSNKKAKASSIVVNHGLKQLTFKDLKKRVTQELGQQHSRVFEGLQNKPFWIWDIEEHKQEDIRTNGDCCFSLVYQVGIQLTSLSMTMRK